MDSRRRLVSRVLESGFSVSAASKEAGVSRQTAHVWLARANESGGILGMSELSRRPKNSPCSSSPEIVSQVLEIARQYPFWGAEKLYALLWPEGNAPICQRTVSRILSRSGRRVQPMPEPASEFTRFEREESNELWQLDFKKVGPRKNGKETVSTLDDAKRYCLALEVVPDQTLSSLWSVLWDVFGEYGLPKATLSDNGPAFRNNATWRWSSFDLRLMLLGIKPLHGRPYHPQTQERSKESSTSVRA